MREKCKHCGNKLITPSGPIKSETLLIGASPGIEEIKQGAPWVGPGGDVLRKELTLAGMHPGKCRVTNLWLHTKNPKECDVDFHLDEMFNELLGRKYILIMGAETLRAFLPDAKVSEWSGLEILSPELPKGARAMAMVNPAIALRDVHGEVRFAIRNFAGMTRE